MKRSIVRKLGWAFGAAVLALLLQIGGFFLFSQGLFQGLSEIYRFQKLGIILVQGQEELRVLVGTIPQAAPTRQKEELRKIFGVRLEAVKKSLGTVKALLPWEAASSQLFGTVEGGLKQIEGLTETIFLATSVEDDEAQRLLIERHEIEGLEALEKIRLQVKDRIDSSVEKAYRMRKQPLVLGLLLTLVLTVLMGSVGAVVTGQIRLPIRNLLKATEAVARGDLTRETPVVSDDELGVLTQHFNQMIRELKKSGEEILSHMEREKELAVEAARAGAEKARVYELAKLADELERSNAELQQFASIASHDLQEPLRMVSSFTELLQQRYGGRLDKTADEFIGFAQDGAKRMVQLIGDLLEYSRVGSKAKELRPTDCEEGLKRALTNLKISLEETGAKVTHDALPTVVGDQGELTRLFQNLIGNAIKFGRSGEAPRIHVSASPSPSATLPAEWLFSIKDNGIGIDPRYFDRIFLIFQRLHGRGDYPGTGIGLAVCKKIVERHRGRIWVESQPGQGATFFFTLPGERSGEGLPGT